MKAQIAVSFSVNYNCNFTLVHIAKAINDSVSSHESLNSFPVFIPFSVIPIELMKKLVKDSLLLKR